RSSFTFTFTAGVKPAMSFVALYSSLSNEPRATVFSISGRTERPSAKKSLADWGRFFGWLAISWRIASSHPLNAMAHNAAAHQDALIFIADLRHMLGVYALQTPRRHVQVELRAVRINAQDEVAERSVLEPSK